MRLFSSSLLRACLAALLVWGISAQAFAAGAPKGAKTAKSAGDAAVTAEEQTSADAAGTADAAKQKKIKYKAGKQVDFDKQTIQGELRRPEISVVTGNDKTTDNGLLRLREDFVDRITAHAGEEVE